MSQPVRTLFLFLAKWHSEARVGLASFSVRRWGSNRHSGCFHFLVVVSKAAVQCAYKCVHKCEFSRVCT